MRAALRAPGLHFLLLGGALFAASAWWEPAPGGAEARPRVVIAAADLTRLRAAWTEGRGTPPSPAAEAALVETAIEEEILAREALARGLDRRDPLVLERLVRLGRFLDEAAPDDGAAEDGARRLGLAARDVVIRRHLVHAMRLALARVPPAEHPDEAEVEAYFAAHAARFVEPPRRRLTHVYLARDRHGSALEAEAARLLAALRRAPGRAGEAPPLGDAFAWGQTATGSREELGRIFGPGFADAVWEAPPGTWTGPVRSAYGLHLVRVDERLPGRVPPLAAVRNQVVHRLLHEAGQARLARRLRALRARYEVVVERDGAR